MSDVYLKMLGPKREAINNGVGVWPYRKWTEPIWPVPCEQGWHVCTPVQALNWLPSTVNHVWLVEIRGEIVDAGDKTVAESARLIRRLNWSDYTARMFAADCAEKVLPIFEGYVPGDDRPRKAIEAARAYALGEITAAAGDAAWDAATDAARAALWDAARAAARAAAAAAAAARAAAREWQAERLMHWLESDNPQ